MKETAAKREIAKQHLHRHHPPPPPPPPPHLTAGRQRGAPLAKKSYGYKFLSDDQAAAVKQETKETAAREDEDSAVGTREGTSHGHREGGGGGDHDALNEPEEKPPTMEKLAKLPIKDAVRLAIRYRLLDHLPELEKAPLVEWGKGGADADVKAALAYTLYDHPLLGNRDAASSHHSVGPGPPGHHLPVAVRKPSLPAVPPA